MIWTDETAIVLNQRRGGYRIWRTSDEVYTKSAIRKRWKGYSEFMFWGSFTYDKKGPCHCFLPESAAEKRIIQRTIDEMNKELEPILRTEWELKTSMSRLSLRNLGGPKPQWKWDQKHGKLQRSSNGGIDWWRYQKYILIPKLLPFAKECQNERPGTLVQEDNAPSHVHFIQTRIYNHYEIQRLLWCANSPDLNAIEPAWFWLKRNTTKKGPPKTRTDALKIWPEWWNKLPQDVIRSWIERIPIHVQQIIQLDGGNEYQEGKKHLQRSHS